MRDYIGSFCEEFEYPFDASRFLLSEYDKLSKNESAYALFEQPVKLYGSDLLTDYDEAFCQMDRVSDLTGVHKYTVHLLLLICLTKHAKLLYEKRNISYDIYYDSMSDLKWKLAECRRMHGVWGTCVSGRYPGFFNLTRFALGRLQYEPVPFNNSYEKGGHIINPGDTVLNIHIPSSGALKHEDCLESYKKAHVFFREYFIDKPTVFVCYSWVLFPSHTEFLPESSNILTFMNDFDIISSSINDGYSDLWRIFNKPFQGGTGDLPRDTSLQRAYIDWIDKGNKTGNGYGIFLFDGEKRI